MKIKNLKFKILCVLCVLCGYSFGLVADLNDDCTVNFSDFAILAANWQSSGTGDLDNSGKVDYADLTIFASHWLDACITYCTTDPDAATTPEPANHAVDVPITQILTWSVADCNGETTLNDVWFGESGGSMAKVITASASHSYSPTLVISHNYQWRIDTVNAHGTTTGTVWDFNCVGQVAPTANDVNVSVVAYVPQTVQLEGSDSDNYPNRLKYLITDLPNDVNAYLQDPTSGGQIRIRESDLPYKLSTWGSSVIFATSTTAGDCNFAYKVYDGNLYSDEKTVSVTVAANPKDCLSFDGSGSVSIPDTGDYFDLDPNRGIALFVQTRQLYCKLLDKYEAGAAGYELYLINGRPQVYLYDSTGLVASVKHNVRVADGKWHQIGFIYDPNGFLMVSECNETNFTTENFEFTSTYWIAVPVRDYSNSSNLIIGSGYRGQIDNLRAYNLILTNNWFMYVAFVCQSRAAAGDLSEIFSITLYPGASARFFCDYNGTTNTATQIYDDVSASHLIGAISDANHVKYIPFKWHWWDATVLRRQR